MADNHEQIVKNNARSKPLRWTTNHAAMEFGLNRRTLQRKLVEAGIAAGEDGHYSTVQIMAAIIGDLKTDLKTERLRKVKAEADHVELKNAQHRRELLPREEVYRTMEGTFYQMRGVILGSSTDEHVKHSLLAALEDITPPA